MVPSADHWDRGRVVRWVSDMMDVYAAPAAFTEAECLRILDQIASAPTRDAKLVGQAQHHNVRRADLVWLDEVEGCEWVTERAIDLVRVANREMFDFDITDFSESPQVARYDSSREGHFDWHSDIGDGRLAARRKLTIVIQLDAGAGYQGGDLQIMPSNHTVTAARRRGDAVMFPSFMLHRVTPVTKGTRHSLTLWCHGPSFR